jgi:hypothetical protein
MTEKNAEESRVPSGPTQPLLRVVDTVTGEPENARSPESTVERFLAGLDAAQERAESLAARVEDVRGELQRVRVALAEAEASRSFVPYAGVLLRLGVVASLAGLFVLTFWAAGVDYALRVTSDTPTFLALVADMAQRPFAEQSPFLNADVATQHATPYMQALSFVWRGLHGSDPAPEALGRFLALVGIGIFAFTLWCVFAYVRRLAGTTAAWVAIPVLLGIFGPPHVIWASDLSLHAVLYAGFFPQNLAIATTLLALLMLERRSPASLAAACLLTTFTMLVHPFTGVLLCVLATVEGCRLAANRDRAAVRAPLALGVGFALGMLWPAYSLDRAFAETGVRGIVFVGVCVIAPLVAWRTSDVIRSSTFADRVRRAVTRLDTAEAAFRLALVGIAGTAAIAAWELALVHSPPHESARLAIYWVDDRWRWPLLLVAGAVGVSGLARLARRGQIVAPVWFAGCFALGTLGALGLPLPVWYRFLLLCQIPLAVGVATVVVEGRRPKTTGLVAATFVLALSVKVGTLILAPATVSYFGQPLQPVWTLGEHIPAGQGLVATDPATAYFIPSTTGRRVLTVDKGHVSSRQELDQASNGYTLLRRYYAGGKGWWSAGQEMWRRGVRYVVIAKQTTLQPKTLDDFIWQNARLRTAAQRAALGNYFYENNRVGTLVFDSDDYAVYRLDHEKLFPRERQS